MNAAEGLRGILFETVHRRKDGSEFPVEVSHHRGKNNLQVVVSLLGLQTYCSDNARVLDILMNTRNRVRSMALLHETLYRSGNLAHISFAAYRNDLCRQIVSSFGGSGQRIGVQTRAGEIGLPLDPAVPWD